MSINIIRPAGLRRADVDPEYVDNTIYLANSIPEAKGLEEITDPFLKAKVADALDVGRDPKAMAHLAKVLAKGYPRAAEKVLKQAKYLASLPTSG